MAGYAPFAAWWAAAAWAVAVAAWAAAWAVAAAAWAVLAWVAGYSPLDLSVLDLATSVPGIIL